MDRGVPRCVAAGRDNRAVYPKPQVSYDAIVLSGGAGRRLGGLDKATLAVGNRTLLDRVLAACADAGRVVVVGPARETERAVIWTCESPPGGGPVAAVAAGLPLTVADVVAVLAVDLPFLTAATVARLAAAAAGDGSDGAVLVGDGDRDQPLTAAYRRDALVRRLAELGDSAGQAMSALVRGLRLVRLPDDERAGEDCDTPEQLANARARAGREGDAR